MGITHEDFQRAIRISRAIQEFLEHTGRQGVRSTDLYPYLSRKGLIEKDAHNGLFLRKFLRKLKENDMLKLIPQCTYRTTETEFLEWHFYSIRKINNPTAEVRDFTTNGNIVTPNMPEEEINLKIESLHPLVQSLPKINDKNLDSYTKEIRRMYKRAFEIWSNRELEIMTEAYSEFGRIDKVAELLQRQPHIVEKKLREKNLLPS
jgi:hypothetical protein